MGRVLAEGKEVRERWLEAGDVAEYSGVRPVRSLVLPVHVNLVFVGFDGAGGNRFHLGNATLRAWFEHLENFVHHSHINELFNAGGDRADEELPAVPPEALSYRYYFHVVQLSPRVREALEAVMKTHMRPDVPSGTEPGAPEPGPRFYLDSHVMTSALSHLQRHLAGASTALRAFTLFVLNPRRDALLSTALGEAGREGSGPRLQHARYGYRHGLAPHEVQQILRRVGDKDAPRSLRTLRVDKGDGEGSAPAAEEAHLPEHARSEGGREEDGKAAHLRPLMEHLQRGSGSGHSGQRTGHRVTPPPRLAGESAVLDLLSAGDDDAVAALEGRHGNVARQERARTVSWHSLEKESGEWADQVLAALEGDATSGSARKSAVTLADDILSKGTVAQQRALRKALREQWHVERGRGAAAPADAGSQAAEDDEEEANTETGCAVDTWVAEERLAFLDLSAGPSEWGPIVGGRGVRDADTLPSVPDTGKSASAGSGGSATRQDVQRLEGRIRDLQNEEALVTELRKMACEEAEGEDQTYCRSLTKRTVRVVAAVHAYEEALKAAKGGGTARDRLQALVTRAAELERTALGVNAPLPPSGFDPGPAASLHEDNFLAELGTAIMRMMRHVVTPPSTFPPPTAPEPRPPSLLDFHTHARKHDRAVQVGRPDAWQPLFVAERPQPASRVRLPHAVEYRLTVIRAQTRYDPVARTAGALDVEELRRQLRRLRVSAQDVRFSAHVVSVEDDPALSVALAVATREAVLPTLAQDGSFVAERRTYLDSAALQHQLHRWGANEEGEGKPGSPRGDVRVVPIYVLSLGGETPVLLDKYHPARAAGGAVLAVQSDHPRFRSPFRCNGRTLTWNLLNPARHIVTAALAVGAGLPRSHLGPAARSGSAASAADVEQDWAWSVGVNPSALTADCSSLSHAQIDAAHRNEVARALLASLALVNAAAQTLGAHPTTEENARGLGHDLQRVLAAAASLYHDVQALWQRVSDDVETLHFKRALRRAGRLTDLSNALYTRTLNASALMSPFRCVGGSLGGESSGARPLFDPLVAETAPQGHAAREPPATAAKVDPTTATRASWLTRALHFLGRLVRRVVDHAVYAAPLALVGVVALAFGGRTVWVLARRALDRARGSKPKLN